MPATKEKKAQLEKKLALLKAKADPENLYGYQLLLNDAVEKTGDTLLPNSGPKHAALMYSQMFDVTQDEAAMVVGDFCGKVSDDEFYLASLEDMLERESVRNVRVIILDDPNPDSKALELLWLYSIIKPGKIELRRGVEGKTKELIAANLENHGKPIHWSVFDNDKFRVEVTTKSFSAIGGFHQTEQAAWLKGVFEQVYASTFPYTA